MHQPFIADLWTLQKPIGRFGGGKVSHLLGQRRRRFAGQITYHLHCPLRASLISSSHRSIHHDCPLRCTWPRICLHLFFSFFSLFLLSFPPFSHLLTRNLWGRDSAEKTWGGGPWVQYISLKDKRGKNKTRKLPIWHTTRKEKEKSKELSMYR